MKFPRYILSSLSILALASCANDEPATKPDSAAAVVRAEIGELSSRASGTQWNPDDLIGISGTSASVTYSNVPYQTDGSGVFTPFFGFANGIIYQDANDVTFSAYYPYNKEVTAENTRISASTENQGDARDFDFLFASEATGSLSNPELNFTGKTAFAHRMAQLVINVTADSDNGFEDVDVLSNARYTVKGLSHEGEFDTATGIATLTSSATADLSLDPALATIKDRTATHKLILFPQTASQVELCIEIEGATYSCTFSPRLEAGKAYTANFNLKRSGLTFRNFTIMVWISNGGTYTGEVTYNDPKEIVVNGHRGILMRNSYGEKGTDSYVPALYVATCNLGGSTPGDTGKYFWWGDIEGHEYNSGYVFGAGESMSTQKYPETLYNEGWLTSADGFTGILTPAHDAASQQWGAEWCIPTIEDMQWLIDNAEWTRVANYNNTNVTGIRVVSKFTNQEIFMRAAGEVEYKYQEDLDNIGCYGISTACMTYVGYQYNPVLFFQSDAEILNIQRYKGRPIRPVLKR